MAEGLLSEVCLCLCVVCLGHCFWPLNNNFYLFRAKGAPHIHQFFPESMSGNWPIKQLQAISMSASTCRDVFHWSRASLMPFLFLFTKHISVERRQLEFLYSYPKRVHPIRADFCKLTNLAARPKNMPEYSWAGDPYVISCMQRCPYWQGPMVPPSKKRQMLFVLWCGFWYLCWRGILGHPQLTFLVLESVDKLLFKIWLVKSWVKFNSRALTL